ncbi:MAG: helix-turn-helix domain-containing protein [Proteobacteria bacterium]|nr:helix-turn-helix domain-containing protein [Pseudomonadota bacterium]
MELDPHVCYAALAAHDARFDGRFFVGVTSTGIYCRPVCRVRLPKAAHCTFHAHAAAAEAAGFRPCLKCRPELAPGFGQTEAGDALARAAARLIDEGWALPDVATRVGVTERHLRRLFANAFGVAPVQYAQTQRLLLAKRLLTDTALPVAEVAVASGFASTRRLQALFQSRYGLAPSRLRRTGSALQDEGLTLRLAYRPPYDWPRLLGFLARRTIPGVEAVVGEGEAATYQRTVRIGRTSGWLTVAHEPARQALRVMVAPGLAPHTAALLARLRRQFDVGAEPQAIAAVLGPLAEGAEGLRLPGAFDGFELAVRAVLGQQVTVAAARTLASRFAAAFGTPLATPHAALHGLFPDAHTVARQGRDAVARLGIVAQRADAILALARAVADDTLRLDAGADPAQTMAALQAVPGIGPWTAHYIAMRALAWPDAWLPADVALLNAQGLPRTAAGQRESLARAEAWRPWRSYAVLHTWRQLEASP